MLTDFMIKTVNFPSRSIFSIRRNIAMKDMGEAYSALTAGLKKNRLHPVGPVFSVFHDEDFNKECSDIELGVEVTDTAGEDIRILAPGLCCCIQYIGPYDDYSLCFFALREWIDREGYSISGPPIIQYVKGYYNSSEPEKFETLIIVPIRK